MNLRVASWRTTLPLGRRRAETVPGLPMSFAQKAAARPGHTSVRPDAGLGFPFLALAAMPSRLFSCWGTCRMHNLASQP